MAMVFCRGCGKEIHDSAPICPHCGAPQNVPGGGTGTTGNSGKGLKNQTAAGLWCAFLGGFGAHWFYLGNTVAGVLSVLFFWTYIPSVVSFFNLFSIAFSSPEKWAKKYNNGVLMDPVSVAVKVIVLILPTIAVIGIVAAIALPAYQDYTMRAKTASAVLSMQSPKTALTEFLQSSNGTQLDDAGIQKIIATTVAGSNATVTDAFAYKNYADVVAEVDLHSDGGKGHIVMVTQDAGATWSCEYEGIRPTYMSKTCTVFQKLDRPAIEIPHVGLWTEKYAQESIMTCASAESFKDDPRAEETCKCMIPRIAAQVPQVKMEAELSPDDLRFVQEVRTSCSQ